MSRMTYPQVLVIEDVDQDFLLFQQTLGSDNEVTRARSGEEALKILLSNLPEVILLSVELPEPHGLEVLHEIKNEPSCSHIPVIMTSSEDDIISKMEAFNGGAVDYILKPFVPAEFRARLQAHIRQFQRQYYANPLSGLPGNVVIEVEIQDRVTSKEPFTIFHVDLSQFKAFNDKYGYDRGDEALILTRNILLAAKESHGDDGDFIGHIGGDDFIYISSAHDCTGLCEEIISVFDKKILELYDPKDRKKKGIEATNRRGEKEKFPVMTIGLAGVTNEKRKILDYREVATLLSQVKYKVKQNNHSSFYVDQRTK